MNQFIKENAECLVTLAGVVLYEILKNAVQAMGIGWAAALFGIVLTVVGVWMTLVSGKDRSGKMKALAVHAGLWILKGLIGWIAGILIARYIIYHYIIKSKKEEDEESMTIEKLPANLYSGTNCYKRGRSFGGGVEYINESNPGDRITISTIYGATDSEVSTNAGHFFQN